MKVAERVGTGDVDFVPRYVWQKNPKVVVETEAFRQKPKSEKASKVKSVDNVRSFILDFLDLGYLRSAVLLCLGRMI